ncbi:MAG: histidine kinase [Saprospiraceae bacterium]
MKEKENQKLIVLNANAKMEILRSRIQPHFLFNTLNTIYSFTLFDHSKTSGMLSKLYNILHYMIYDCNTPQISFNKEINALLDYINLERERYGEKLSLHIKQSGSFQNKKITPLLLQPFVENAFKHGASKMIYHPWIDISISIQDHLLYFTISNSISENNSLSDTSGIGLDNIRKRLAILYPDQHVFEINKTEQVYTAKLIIPLAEDPSST